MSDYAIRTERVHRTSERRVFITTIQNASTSGENGAESRRMRRCEMLWPEPVSEGNPARRVRTTVADTVPTAGRRLE
jgi:hypothetical protein